MSEARKQQILNAIQSELRRSGGKIDPLALATAIDRALDADTGAGSGVAGAPASPEGAYAGADEGRTPASSTPAMTTGGGSGRLAGR